MASSKAAAAMWPDLKGEASAVREQGKIPKDISAAKAMYGKPKPQAPKMVNVRGRVPMTYESLSHVPGLKPVQQRR
jgi:hypothetical protein